MELVATNHSYYSSDSNFYVNGTENFGRSDYETWEYFKESWLCADGTLDDDYNHIFRFDIINKVDEDGEEIKGEFELWLFFILQRKGIYRPVCIQSIYQSDMLEITDFLQKRFNYLKSQWSEFI